ncbi:MAG: hypothetical protein Fur0022_11160 [Anaerolineales bacterium]
MQLPSYWLTRPPFELTEAHRSAFNALLDQPQNPAFPLEYTLDAPKWAFLCYAAEERGLALHGSLNPDITEFEPRQSSDLREFGAQKAVYAASDGIWPMYFAIVDRIRYPMSIINACVRIEMPDGSMMPSLYFFSVPKQLIDLHPYTNGVVYLLPKETFITDTPIPFGPMKVHPAQLASLVAVKPLAKLAVTPDDFPFLATMRAHDESRLEEYAHAMSNGLPWPDAG